MEAPKVIISNKGLDWAVIQCDFGEKLHNAICFCSGPLSGGTFVETEGFQAVRYKDPDGLLQLGFQGHGQLKADSTDYFNSGWRSAVGGL